MCYIARLASLFSAQTPFDFYFFPPVALRPSADPVLLILEVSRSHTTMSHSRYDPFGRVISSSQRTLPDNTQHLGQKNIHAPGGIRTRNFSRRQAADLRLRLHGHWDRHWAFILLVINQTLLKTPTVSFIVLLQATEVHYTVCFNKILFCFLNKLKDTEY